MSFVGSAIVLAWVAIALLALGLAGLLRQVTVLSRGRLGSSSGADGAAGSARSPRDLVGFRLPTTGPVGRLLDGLPTGAHRTVVAFVSPGCSSCEATLRALAAVDVVADGSVAILAASTGSCEPAQAALTGVDASCLGQARAAMDALFVPATPYLVSLTEDATLVAALLPQEDTDIAAWVRHTRGSLTVKESR